MERLEERLVLSAIVVTSTGDTIAADGFVTLREAITSINNGANTNADVAGVGAYGINDTIQFNIAGAGVHTISPDSELPAIVKPVLINGYSQTGSSVNTQVSTDNAVLSIQLDGTNAGLRVDGLGANGLILGAGSNASTLTGLTINRFLGSQILVQSDGNSIVGNFLGTTVTGNAGASTTGGAGIEIDGTFRNTIGGTAPAARNIIGGNSDGVTLNSGTQNTIIQGNLIGIGANRTAVVGNRLHGVALQGNGGLGVQNNEIGGTQVGAGNTIANSGSAGVAVFGDALSTRKNSGNTILGNSIFNNGLSNPNTLPGIDLSSGVAYPNDNGVTVNDLKDVDTGPNQLQNFPVLTSAASTAGGTTILGSLNSAPKTTYRIEFFSNPTVVGTEFGQGQTFLGFKNVTTDLNGLANFSATIATVVQNGQYVTATATSGGIAPGTTPTGIGPSVLGTAENFAVLAGATVTITGPTVLIGDIGVSPGTAIDGNFVTTGTVHAADPVAAQAKADLDIAYGILAGLAPTMDLTGVDLGGKVLVPGIYHFDTSAQLTGILTLDTQGDPHALFVFQIGSTLTTSVGSGVVVLGGPDDSIFWQVGSAATIGVGTSFVGNILASAAITLNTGATLSNGRALARTEAVTMDTIVADSTTPTQNNTSEFSAAVQVAIPTISIGNATVAEGNAGTTNAVFTLTLSAASGQPVSVLATLANGTAASPSDFTALAPTTVTFAPGETTKTVTIAVNGDTLNEPTETFFVNLTVPINSTISDAQGLGTITNDDAVPTLSINNVTVVEGNAGTTNAVFTVTLSAASVQVVTVLATSANNTAASGSDFLALVPTTLTFAPGETTKTVIVAVNGDLLNELAETYFVNLTSPTNSTIVDAQAIGTINNDDAVPSLSINSVSVVEGNVGTANAVFTVSLSAPSSQVVTVLATSADGTATLPADYLALTPTTLTFAPGETVKTINVAVNADLLNELSESFSVNLSAATNSTISDNQGIGTIVDNDGAPTLSIDDVTITEGNAGTTNAVFTVNLSAPSTQVVTVLATSTNGTATSTSDYSTLVPTTLTFAPGETTKTITVAVNGDLLSEPSENFFINLSSATNANVADAQGVGTVSNDDAPPTASIDDVTIVEGNAGTTNAVFTVTLSEASGQTVTLLATTADGSATEGTDYLSLVPTTLTFAPGETTKTITVAINGEVLKESNETFFVNLNAPTNVTIANNQGLGTITDDDQASVLTISSPTVVEGNAGTTSMTFTVTSSDAVPGGFSVVFNIANLTTNNADYTSGTTGPLTFVGTAGETQTITIAVHGDNLLESDETLSVTLGAVTSPGQGGATVVSGASGAGTIVNDDFASVSITKTIDGIEGNPSTAGRFQVTQSAISSTDTVVNYTIGGTATAGVDFTTLTGSVTIPAGQMSANIDVTVLNDSLVENTETLSLTLTGFGAHDALVTLSPISASLTATMNISDDDRLAITTATSANVAENTPSSTVVLDVNTSATPGHTVTYALSGPDAVLFAINSVGEIRYIASPDYESPHDQDSNNIYQLTVTATADLAPPQSTSQDLAITVTPTNDNAPVITAGLTATSVRGNMGTTPVLFDINATDSDLPAQLLTFGLVGPDAARFTINPATGEIKFTASPDFAHPLDQGGDNVYNVTVTVTDNVNPTLSASQALTVTVTPSNVDAPVITSGPTATVAENTSNANVVLDVNATDASIPAQTITYTLSGPDNAAFSINATTGEIRFVVSPDYEAPTDQGSDNVYNVTVKATDNGVPILGTSQALIITVTPVNDNGPVFVDASPTFSIPENSLPGTNVGVVTATDLDRPAHTVTYAIISGNESGAFAIDPATGQITVADSAPLDYEVTQQFTFIVRATNNASPTVGAADATVVVNVTDVLEGPTVTIPFPQGLYHMERIPAFTSPDATFTYGDIANPNYDGAQLTTAITVNRSRRDALTIYPKGNGANEIGIKGKKLFFGGVQIGTFIGGKGARHPELVVTFNSHATTAAIDHLVRRLNFQVFDKIGTTRTVIIKVTNIAGADSNVATRDIAVTHRID